MARNLVVREGQTLTLDGDLAGEWADSFIEAPIKKLQDLVDIGLISTTTNLQTLLTAAQTSTNAAIQKFALPKSSQEGMDGVAIDLDRYPSFIANSSSVPHNEATVFWRVARHISPSELSTIDIQAGISLIELNTTTGLLYYNFNDVTLEPRATLKITRSINLLWCDNLLIERDARIQARTVWIKANSIQGNQ